MKTPAKKVTVDTAEETKIIKAEMNFVLRKKTLRNEKMGIIVVCEIFSQ